jgi:hypothetical protein
MKFLCLVYGAEGDIVKMDDRECLAYDLVLSEPIGWMRWRGILLITCGIALVAWFNA